MLSRLLARAGEDPFSHAAAVFDAPGPTFRHKLFPKYKAARERPDDLRDQLPLMREAARSMGIEPIEHIGFEADDVIATLASMAAMVGRRCTIVTVDKDFGQLVVDDVIELVDPVKRVRVREKDVVEAFGVMPALVPDVQALCGDAVDNIPGVDGIGLLKAAAIIRTHGSLDDLFRDMRQGKFMTTPSIRSAMQRARKNIPLYRKLATLRRDVPLKIDWEEFRPRRFERSHGRDILRALEAEHMFGQIFGDRTDQKMIRVVEHVHDAFEWWREELLAPGQPVNSFPQCGFFSRRLMKDGAPVGGRIWREAEIDFITQRPTGMDMLLCDVDGKRRDPFDQWGYLCMSPLSERAYRALCGKVAKSRETLSEKVDLMIVKPPIFKKKGKSR